MPIDPETAEAVKRSTWDIARFFANQVGIGPRGELRKFARTIYPFMATHAELTGIPVYAFWFGDVIRVAPSGGHGVVAMPGTLPLAEVVFNDEADKEGEIWVIRCGAGIDEGTPAIITSRCSFDKIRGGFVGRVRDRVDDFLDPDGLIPVPRDRRDPGPSFITAGFGDVPFFALVAVIGLFLILPRLSD